MTPCETNFAYSVANFTPRRPPRRRHRKSGSSFWTVVGALACAAISSYAAVKVAEWLHASGAW